MASSSSTMEKEAAAATADKAHRPASKKRGTLSFLRAASFMARSRRSPTKKPPLEEAEAVRPHGKDLWKSLVGGMRPLHLHQLEDIPNPPPPPPVQPAFDRFHDVLPPPPSPSHSSADGMSCYTSVEDLQLLDVIEEEDGVAIIRGGEGVSNEIDVKAEEFIGRFYQQIRLQRLESIGRAAAGESAC